MSDKHTVMEQIHAAFQALEFPGESFLQGSFEGTEPYDEVGPFRGQTNWQTLEATFLDAHASALSFFSEAGFRFFLPAYLLADLNDQLQTADPVFHLTHGFFEFSVTVPAGGRVFVRKSGKSVLLNPRRYGAMTVSDYARYRLSIFTREEASAIVAYLEFKRDHDPDSLDSRAWRPPWSPSGGSTPAARHRRKPSRQHLADEAEFVSAIQSGVPGNRSPS